MKLIYFVFVFNLIVGHSFGQFDFVKLNSFDQIRNIVQNDDEILFISDSDKIMVSLDFGDNFEQFLSEFPLIYDINFITDSILGILYLDEDLKTRNLLRYDIYKELSDTINLPFNYAFNFLSFKDSIGFIGAVGGNLLRSKDYGTTWEQILTPTNLFIRDISYLNDSTLIIATGLINFGGVIISENLGESWKSYESVINSHIFSIHNIGRDYLIASSINGKYFVSIDFGETWSQRMVTNEANLINLDFNINNNKGILSGGHQDTASIFCSINHGQNWNLVFNENIGGVTSQSITKNKYYYFGTDKGYLIKLNSDSLSNIHEQSQGLNAILYPNPSAEEITIELLSGNYPIQNIEIYNNSFQPIGKVEFWVNNSKLVIPVANFTPGLYFVRLSGSSSNTILKFIRQ